MIANKTGLGYEIHIPQVFDKYKVIKYLNRGSFSVVYQILDQRTHDIYCAKVISVEDMINQDLFNSMQNEIDILKMIDHPNIIKLIDSLKIKNDQGEEFFVIITEYCSYGNLSDYIYDNSDIPTEDVKFFIHSIIDAIVYLHSIGIAHCDIKPSNILLDEELNPKLCDFNISKNVITTKDTSCGGTYEYMAPEVDSDEKIDFMKADIFSLGITIYEIAEKELPFIDDDKGNRTFCMTTYDDELKDIVEKCINFDPQKRTEAENLLNEPYLDYYYEDKHCDYADNFDCEYDYAYDDYVSKGNMKKKKNY